MAATEAAATPATSPPQNSSLYVGDLDREATEASLYELFSQVSFILAAAVVLQSAGSTLLYVTAQAHASISCAQLIPEMSSGRPCGIHPRLP